MIDKHCANDRKIKLKLHDLTEHSATDQEEMDIVTAKISEAYKYCL